METTLFNKVIAEYKTQKAAAKHASRIIQNTEVVKSTRSVYDPFWPSGKAVWQVCLVEA